MELFIVSSPVAIPNEAQILQQLFEEGLSILHLRKPNYSENETMELLQGIDSKFHPRICLHQQEQLTGRFEINRLHFSELKRKETDTSQFIKLADQGIILSTSVHSRKNFDELPDYFSYAFIGPVFDSISKENYAASKEDLNFVQKQKVKPVALGGINEKNIKIVFEKGFQGIAVLGYIWNHPENAVENFIRLNDIKSKVTHHVR